MAEMMQILGMDNVRANLRALGRDVLTEPEVLSALRAAGAVIQKEAVAKAAQSSHPHKVGRKKNFVVLPGFLKKNIRVVRRKSDHYASVSVGVRTKAFYWRFLEFGTRYQRARPFLRPAFEQMKKQAVEAAVARLGKRLTSEIRKMKKRVGK
jgi:HK97 gp10 family phage protein